MSQQLIATRIRTGFFDTVEQADRAVRRLLAAGFSQDQLAVVCPPKFEKHFLSETRQAETPTANAGSAIAMGGALGATLGGLALAATVVTGGAAGVMGAVFLIGGGAFAGAFSNLIVSKGYENEVDDDYKRAIERGQIVVGVEIHSEDHAGQLEEAQRILEEAGAKGIESA